MTNRTQAVDEELAARFKFCRNGGRRLVAGHGDVKAVVGRQSSVVGGHFLNRDTAPLVPKGDPFLTDPPTDKLTTDD
jgi:hypothetical protein